MWLRAQYPCIHVSEYSCTHMIVLTLSTSQFCTALCIFYRQFRMESVPDPLLRCRILTVWCYLLGQRDEALCVKIKECFQAEVETELL